MNIADRLRDSAQRLPAKPALHYQGQVLTYEELDDRVDRAAAAFQQLGLMPGDRVGLLLGNSPHFVECAYGALRAGLVAVPLNTGFTTEEIARILGDSGARAVVTGEAYYPALMGVAEGLPGLEDVVVAGASAPPVGAQTWRQLLDSAPARPRVNEVDDGLALLQYTSGTTGQPKGAMLSHANLLVNQEQMRGTRLKLFEQDVVLCVLPLFHIYGFNVGLALPLSCGASVCLVERFDPVTTMEQIVRMRVSVVIGAPPTYIAWANVPGVERYDLRNLRFAVSGAAQLPEAVLRRFTKDLGVPLWEGYGLTETSPVLTLAAKNAEPRPGSVGRPVQGVALRLIDDRGHPVGDGDLGEVTVRGPNVFSGYWNAQAATAEAIDKDGWFHTGDIGYLVDGDLYLVDRKSDLIIVSGFNVYPREIEDVICRHPKVAEVAVVGMPHPYTGESIKAVVVLRETEEATAEEIIRFCNRWIARFKCPTVVEFVDELPHALSGKVKRRQLRE
jgi:long-chain acyl-CoA synthetase